MTQDSGAGSPKEPVGVCYRAAIGVGAYYPSMSTDLSTPTGHHPQPEP